MSKQTGRGRRAFTVRRHVVQFSGGIGSFAVAVWVARKYGTRNLTLLIADTGIEDDDLWRFAEDTSQLLGVPLTKVADGRTPWEVFRDVRFLGNDRLAPCTRLLKQVPCREWMEQHADPADTLVYVGIENNRRDRARIPAIARNWKPWVTRFPLCGKWEPARTKEQLLDEARALGVAPPRLYGLGFGHNNCGGRAFARASASGSTCWRSCPSGTRTPRSGRRNCGSCSATSASSVIAEAASAGPSR
ncbi:hypothetical protein OG819_54905 [Streptomyces sp. NBC_01549]|uniref:hypothetical protein n=1 Tax=Streptomyces sp. NBC_01549 TaxID=2975874 RepID=UPI00224F6E18|nr:hypothetical protein [Streptomyces sp. NBC_01549]MCX4598249.1 hypothetical protein [Streptomyces sp. NBC_01549]